MKTVVVLAAGVAMVATGIALFATVVLTGDDTPKHPKPQHPQIVKPKTSATHPAAFGAPSVVEAGGGASYVCNATRVGAKLYAVGPQYPGNTPNFKYWTCQPWGFPSYQYAAYMNGQLFTNWAPYSWDTGWIGWTMDQYA